MEAKVRAYYRIRLKGKQFVLSASLNVFIFYLLISSSKVRKMKENYELKEKTLLQETQVLTDEKNSLNERLRKIDDSFRQQYDVEKKEHFKQVEVMKRGYEEKLQVADLKIEGIEEEMRQILTETSRKKKFYEDKIKSFTSAFRNIQADFEVTA